MSGRVETMSKVPTFRAKVLAIAEARGGGGGKGLALSREAARRLQAGGVRAFVLQESDSLLAGSALGLSLRSDPRVLADIRRTTGAEAVVFLTLDPNWHSLEIAVLEAATGVAVLRATAHAHGEKFSSPEEAGADAAEALSYLAPERQKAAAAAMESSDDLSTP